MPRVTFTVDHEEPVPGAVRHYQKGRAYSVSLQQAEAFVSEGVVVPGVEDGARMAVSVRLPAEGTGGRKGSKKSKSKKEDSSHAKPVQEQEPAKPIDDSRQD